MSKPLISMDQGANGGIAWKFGDDVGAMKMPEGMTGIAEALRDLSDRARLTTGMKPDVIVEKVGSYRPGNSGPAAAKFARHCGQVEAIAYMLDLSTTEVTPSVWQRGVGCPVMTKGADKAEDKKMRKNWVKEFVQRRHPHIKVTLATSDALGILEWALATGKAT